MDYVLDWKQLIEFKPTTMTDWPKVRIPFQLDTPYLKREFTLSLVIWNLTEETLAQTKGVVDYLLTNFNKLFETAWTALYYFYRQNLQCSLAEFYQEKIDFNTMYYYSIQIELNCNYLMDGVPRYHFVVATADDLSDDNLRLYMQDNKCWACDTNNDGTAILASANFEDISLCAASVRKSFEAVYQKMDRGQFQYAPQFGKE